MKNAVFNGPLTNKAEIIRSSRTRLIKNAITSSASAVLLHLFRLFFHRPHLFSVYFSSSFFYVYTMNDTPSLTGGDLSRR